MHNTLQPAMVDRRWYTGDVNALHRACGAYGETPDWAKAQQLVARTLDQVLVQIDERDIHAQRRRMLRQAPADAAIGAARHERIPQACCRALRPSSRLA